MTNLRIFSPKFTPRGRNLPFFFLFSFNVSPSVKSAARRRVLSFGPNSNQPKQIKKKIKNSTQVASQFASEEEARHRITSPTRPPSTATWAHAHQRGPRLVVKRSLVSRSPPSDFLPITTTPSLRVSSLTLLPAAPTHPRAAHPCRSRSSFSFRVMVPARPAVRRPAAGGAGRGRGQPR